MSKREVKVEHKTGVETVERSATPTKKVAAVEKTTPVKTVFEEKKALIVTPGQTEPVKVKKERNYSAFKYEPMKPKRPSSSYVFFVTEYSAILRKEKNYSVTEAMKASGVAWNNMNEAAKVKYEEMAKADHER